MREDGYREILGTRITDCENEEFWSGLFEDLKERGLAGVQLVASDGHTGIPEGGLNRLPRRILTDTENTICFPEGRSSICRIYQVHCTRWY
ncbi:MAG TPA: hypothetical protein GXX59_03425 [Syntrophomonadaceae bacterium]|nr:hypothetical protein [Syntrophomonadaceae bacterium]